MLNPSIGKLITAYDSRYQLVHDVSKKAREVSEKAKQNHEIIIEKSVSIAIDDLAEGIDEK